MHLLWKRYSRSGHAPAWFYGLVGAGFVALAAWAVVRGDWLVAAIAAVMLPVTVGGTRLMRRLSEASEASRRALDGRRDRDER